MVQCHARSQHRGNATNADGRGEMFQGMAAHKIPERKDRPIRHLERFRGHVGADAGEEVARPRVPRIVQHEQHQHDSQRSELRERVRPQIAGAAKLGPIPVRDAAGAEHEKRNEQPAGQRQARALGHDGRQQTHETDRHRQPIPDQASVVGREMIVSRAGSRQRGAGKKSRVGPPLPGIGERPRSRPGRKDGEQPQHARDGERNVRQHVERVWDPEERTPIGHDVIRRVLGDRGPRQHRDHACGRDSRHDRVPRDAHPGHS